MSAPVSPYERPRGRGMNPVFKSGPLFISSKGLGWKLWKQRWFILTRTSLVFFKSDPNTLPHKVGEANLALGGIDLNNSGSVVVREAKKLLTVLFPDGRAFTLKAGTIGDLDEWKVALERALAVAPNAALVMGQSGIFRNDSIDGVEGPTDQVREKRPVKSLVLGRPILLALEDIDGNPSFLEKALCFVEHYGIKVEGILRQSADVDDVDQRIHAYEQGRMEFGMDEDAHVISDCIKLVLRELPSSPVPTPCCTALLEAHRREGRYTRITAMRVAMAETFPEPNRRLLQRVLKMMAAVVAHSAKNRMTSSAVAACMAPLLLRPLLAGECGLEDESDISGDNAAQLLAATTAANNAQAIITSLLEEYDQVFEVDEGCAHQQNSDVQPTLMSMDMHQHANDSASEGSPDDEFSQVPDKGYHDARNDFDVEIEEDGDGPLSGTSSESSGNGECDIYDLKVFEGVELEAESCNVLGSTTRKQQRNGWSQATKSGAEMDGYERVPGSDGCNAPLIVPYSISHLISAGSPVDRLRASVSSSNERGNGKTGSSTTQRSSVNSKRSSVWGISSVGKRTDLADGADSSGEEEIAIQKLEVIRQDLCNKIAKEAKENAALQASLERRKQALHDRCIALEQDVARLQEQLQTERGLQAALGFGTSMSLPLYSMMGSVDNKTRAELEAIAIAEADVARLKLKVTELHVQLKQQRQQQGVSLSETNARYERMKNLQVQQKILQKELDLTLALCHHEKQKNNELEGHDRTGHTSMLEQVIRHQQTALAEAKETLKAERVKGMDVRCHNLYGDWAANNWRQLQPPAAPSCAARQFAWRHGLDSIAADSRQHGTVMSCTSDGGLNNEMSNSNGKRSFMDVEVSNSLGYQRQISSTALSELTTKLDFFKERRSQLMEQLHNLDLTFAPSSVNSHDIVYCSPPLTRQC